ncbi:recombinase family protein [Cytobacillus gottheilii]|uniref:recombinase family protein n=1 Tax=Cytobacillus gottheilii TaxID=859144 RepID=UPI0009BAB1A0|nr:recombinase family protein [Cytobacillus gottheilii]
MQIGYARPYPSDSNREKQNQILQEAGCDLLINEVHFSSGQRPELNHMIKDLKPGDKIIVSSLLTFADSTRNLFELLQKIKSKGAYFHSVQEDIDTSKENNNSFMKIVKHIIDFESDLLSEKTKEGIHEAKQKGSIPGRPRIPDENVKKAIRMYESKKYSLADIKNTTGISKTTLYRYLGKSQDS